MSVSVCLCVCVCVTGLFHAVGNEPPVSSTPSLARGGTQYSEYGNNDTNNNGPGSEIWGLQEQGMQQCVERVLRVGDSGWSIVRRWLMPGPLWRRFFMIFAVFATHNLSPVCVSAGSQRRIAVHAHADAATVGTRCAVAPF